MSSAPTDCRVPITPDPTDATADGQFQQVNRRAGYGDDRMDRIIATARKGWTLAAGEGLVLVQEIDRLRGELRDTHTKVFHLEEKLAWTERERDQLTSIPAERILDALREPSEAVHEAAFSEWLMVDPDPGEISSALDEVIRAAVAAAEKEVQGE